MKNDGAVFDLVMGDVSAVGLEAVARLRTIDDVFMRRVFRDNLPLAQDVLRILTGIGKLKLTREEMQRDLKSIVSSRSLMLDVWGKDSHGAVYNMEVQRGDKLDAKKLRYHSAAMDVDGLKASKDFSELPEQWVVFVMEENPFGTNEGVVVFERTDSGGRRMGDGTHLVVVNGAYWGEDELGYLMADFCESNPDRIRNKLLRKRVQYLKRNPKEVREMCSVWEELIQKEREKTRKQDVLEFVRNIVASTGQSAKDVLTQMGILASEQPKYLSMLYSKDCN